MSKEQNHAKTLYCLYCARPWTPGVVRKSKEHPLGQWRKRIETDLSAGQTIYEMRVDFDEAANELVEGRPQVRSKAASLLTLHTRDVCKDCNTGWMKNLQDVGKPILLQLERVASGTGKSTVAEPLRARLPDCVIFETDVILHVAALGWDTWRNTWLQLAHAIALNGRATVLCGSILPKQLESLPARCLVGPIHFCNLDCSDTVLAGRLRDRPAWRGSSSEAAVAEHQRFAAWLRTHIKPTFDTSRQYPDEVANRIASWIRPLLAPSSA